jgi:autotransporter strand-loop-strand O-heptosyltransferase
MDGMLPPFAPAEASAAVITATSSGEKPAYPPAASQPTQDASDGIRFDFNLGARIVLPQRTEGKWRVRLRDLDSGNILFESENQGAFVNSSKRWYVRFGIEVWSLDEPASSAGEPVWRHEFDPAGQDVLIQFPIGTLGDTLAWFPYAARFAANHPTCRVTQGCSTLTNHQHLE